MAGTKVGGKKTAERNKELYGDDYYQKLGYKSVKAYKERQKLGIAKPRGFDKNRELAREAGRKGGLKSKRGKAKA